ncbi:MAG: carboxypeptidase-like regulatory domain-containing protein [Lentimicrobium sp.]|nr:carboxypeptidase-like regulatory domain-containing protein [Lentimicrobium sp.]
MKTSLKRLQKYKDLHQVLSGYPAAFEGKPEATAMLESLGMLTAQLSEQVSGLTSPVRSVYRTKQEIRDNFMSELNRMTRLCVIIATRTGNQPFLVEVKLYLKQLGAVADLAHYQIATHVSEKLVQYPEESLNLGVTAADITAFNALIFDFGGILGDTNLKLNSRKVGRYDLRQLLKQTSQLLIHQCDNFVEVSRRDYPEMHASYRTIRRRQNQRKKAAKENTADISGIVTHAATGQPIAHAVVELVNRENLFETDADGLFYFDELDSASYTIRCFAPGYQVPDTVTMNPAKGESLVVDFQLIPVDPVLN